MLISKNLICFSDKMFPQKAKIKTIFKGIAQRILFFNNMLK
jgi:hypothetical protein